MMKLSDREPQTVGEILDELDARHGIGGNAPPEPTPLEAAQAEADGIRTEALNWCDGSVAKTQSEADALAKLLELGRKGKARADAAREAEKRPHLEAGRAVDASYKPMLADYDRAATALKAALTPFLTAQEARQRTKAAAAQESATQAYEDAREAFTAAPATDLRARELAETKLVTAKAEAWKAAALDKAKPRAEGTTKAVGLRSVWRAELVNPKAALAHYCAKRRDDVRGLLIDLAIRDVRSGMREIPGFTVHEDRVPV